MAKMFYTMDETKAALGKSEDEVKTLAKEGRLREFRDGARLMFKADQVEGLKAELHGGGGELGAGDIGLSDSRGAAAGTGLAGSGLAGGSLSGTAISGSGLPLVDDGRSPGGGAMTLKDDTALAADLGLSGSVGAMPSPGRPAGISSGAGSGTGLSGTSSKGGSGIDIFQNDEVDRVDPAAQTSISQGIGEQVSMEGIGSGSGLLDLTRESDDTSLGAQLLDDISSGGAGVGSTIPTGSGMVHRSAAGDTAITGTGLSEPRQGGGVRGGSSITFIEQADPMAPAFAGAALAAAAVIVMGSFALITGILDTQPELMQNLKQMSFLKLAGSGLAAAIMFFVVGLVIGKTGKR